MKKKSSGSLGAQLRKRGFDLTTYNRSAGSYHVSCSQCEVLVINGMACHEAGCPNSQVRNKEEEEWESGV